MVIGFWRPNLRERDHLEGTDVDGRIILHWMLHEIGWDDVDWINLALDRQNLR
jgi:hypothetical protein